jgi:pilus assembly protein CpaC
VGFGLPFVLIGLMLAAPASAQQAQIIRVEVGRSQLVQLPYVPSRIFTPEQGIAQAVSLAPSSPQEIVITGLAVGSTTMFVWNQANVPTMYSIQVTPDMTALQAQFAALFPGTDLRATAIGNTIILTGTVSDPSIVRRAIAAAQGAGGPTVTVVSDIQAPTAEQILLHVRFAEVRRQALSRLSADLFGINVGEIEDVVGDGSQTDVATLSGGIVQLILTGQQSQLNAIISALRATGDFRNLAEPNLIATNGFEATFLAGGEFPFPAVQAAGAGGGAANAITVQFREFGVKLRFTPTVTDAGTIRLDVEPEVSSLDFANGVSSGGFVIPSLLTRRAHTQVELAPGQHLAIAGLLDNTLLESVDKIPLLGDLPIIGALFRNRLNQQERTELLVLVTPYIVEPSNVAPRLPTGEPGTWEWNRHMRPDTVNRTMPQQRRGGLLP